MVSLKKVFDSSLADFKKIIVLPIDNSVDERVLYLKYFIQQYSRLNYFNGEDALIARDGNFIECITAGYTLNETLDKYILFTLKNIQRINDKIVNAPISAVRLDEIINTPNIEISYREYYNLPDNVRNDWKWKTLMNSLTDGQIVYYRKLKSMNEIANEQQGFIQSIENNPHIKLTESQYNELPAYIKLKYEWKEVVEGGQHDRIRYYIRGLTRIDAARQKQADYDAFLHQIENTLGMKLTKNQYDNLPSYIKNNFVWNISSSGYQHDPDVHYVRGLSTLDAARQKQEEYDAFLNQIENTLGIQISVDQYNELPTSIKNKYVWTTTYRGYQREQELYYVRGLSHEDAAREQQRLYALFLAKIENDSNTEIAPETYNQLPAEIKNKYEWVKESRSGQYNEHTDVYRRGFTKIEAARNQQIARHNFLLNVENNPNIDLSQSDYDNLPNNIKHKFLWTKKEYRQAPGMYHYVKNLDI